MFNKKKIYLAWLFDLDRSKKRLLLIAFDCLITFISIFLAFFLRLETFDYMYQTDTYISASIAITSTLSIFFAQGLYNNLTRYISTETIFSIFVCIALSSVILLSSIYLLDLEIPLSLSLIFGMLLCIFVIGIRLLIGYVGQEIIKEKRENVAIYGAGASGIQLMDALRKSPNYSVSLFIDDNSELDGKNLGNIPIINFKDVKKKLQNFEIKTLLLVTSNETEVTRQRLFDMISGHPIKVKTIPSISSLIDGKFKIDHMKELKIEDLLGRKPVQCKPELMEKLIEKKIVLVTGAGGSIGGELCRQIILWKPQKLILLDISEFSIYKLHEELRQHPSISELEIVPLIGSVQNSKFIKKILDNFKVDTIYHAAAYKHVPLMEQNVMQCIENNVFGTLKIAELSIAAKVKNFIFVSTDKAVNPTNYMGASKRIAEIICQNLSAQKKETCFAIVRFGNVLGSSGSVVPLFKKQIQAGGPITLTHLDVTRYFMTITEAAQLVIQAGSIAQGGEVFILDMGKPIKILDLATRMVNLSGQQPVFNRNENLKDNEIAIVVSGLRPGEKLFEELTYNHNLIGTIHPRINSAFETSIKSEELKGLLSQIQAAIRDNNYNKLFHNIFKITEGVSDIKTSTDIFMKKNIAEQDREVVIQLNKK